MKRTKNYLVALLCLLSPVLFAHNSQEHASLKQWFIAKDNKTIQASFMMLKDETVYLENEQQQVAQYPLSSLSANDQAYVGQKHAQIERLNHPVTTQQASFWQNFYVLLSHHIWLLGVFVFLLASFFYAYQKKEKIGTTCVFVVTLPVELTTFKAKAVHNTSVLTWQTASETKNKSFTIERSTNGTDYTIIGEVKGNGTTTTLHDYTFTDKDPSVNINYYRLRQTDFDGKETLSKQVSVVFDKSDVSIKTTVNNNTLDVVVSNDKAMALRIFNVAGQQVLTAKVQGAQRLDIQALSNGLYIIQTEKGEAARFLKQ